MTSKRKLIQRYEPVLCFSKDRAGNPERFFPMAARHYANVSGLRREGQGWEYPPGQTKLKHLARLSKPENCYLTYAAGDLTDDDILFKMLDLGLELSRPRQPGVLPAEGDAQGPDLEALPDLRPMVPRILASRERVDELKALLPVLGPVELQPLDAQEIAAPSTGAEGPPSAEMPEATMDMEGAAADLGWIVPLDLSALPDTILRRAVEKYEPYRDWRSHPPVYHYHVCRDGPYRVLQYWFLYAYNDWAAHGGHNDHEGDWEVIYVFLDDHEQPRHVAYSRHVRIPRLYEPSTAPWSEVERVGGTHPVVYVGCGSHASYLGRGIHRLLWLRDYAQGDDLSIGPGTDQPWGHPIRLGNKRWNVRFSGKWGSLLKGWLGTVFPGTLGPTGPAHKGDKWRHPARWAGLL